MERPTGSKNPAQVDVLRESNDLVFEHPRNLIREPILNARVQFFRSERTAASGNDGARFVVESRDVARLVAGEQNASFGEGVVARLNSNTVCEVVFKHGTVKLIMGWPLFALAAYLAFRVIRKARADAPVPPREELEA